MRIGVVTLPELPWREARARWKALEDMGFAHGWTYDHLAWRTLADRPWYGTVPTLTAAATVTTTLRIGTWVTSPNYRHPVTLAKDLMTLDDVSDGRVSAGIGAGGTGWDATVLGQDPLSPRQRVDRLAEFVELLDQLLTRPDTSYRGEWFTAERARMFPAGSRSRIRVLVAANGPRSMRIAAGADGWITTGPPEGSATEAAADDAGTGWWTGVAGLVDRFATITSEAGRDPAEPDRLLDADSAPAFSLSSVGAFADCAGRAAELGFTDLVVHWPRADEPYAGDERVLEQIAGQLRDGQWEGEHSAA